MTLIAIIVACSPTASATGPAMTVPSGMTPTLAT